MDRRTVEQRMTALERRMDRIEGLLTFIGEQLASGWRIASRQLGKR